MIKRVFMITFALCIFVFGAVAQEVTKPKKTTDKNKASILVDVVAGKIGDITIRSEIDEIKKSIGPNRVKKSTEYPEGHPTDVYIIDINGHKIYKHWNATSFTDPVFKMRTGLGVGAKIKDFRRQYGKGEIRGGEGFSLCFESRKPTYYFCIIPVKHNNDLKLNDETVREIWVW